MATFKTYNWFLPLLLWVVLSLQGFGSCQGVMFGGSGGLSTGSGAGGDSSSDGDSGTLTDDSTQFRPASLPPAVDEPSYAITASLSVTGSTATVSGLVTNASSGAVAGSINVTVTQFELTGASAEISAMPSLVTGASDKLAVTGTVLNTQCVTTGSNGQFQASFTSFNASTQKIDATVGCLITSTGASDTAGGSHETRLGAEPQLVSIHNTATGLNTSGSTVSSVSIALKFDESMDLATLNSTNVTLTCSGLGTVTLTYTETTPATDNIATNEFTLSSTQTGTTDESCTLTVTTGVKNVSGNALTQAQSVSLTLQGTGSGGGSSSSSGGGGGGGGGGDGGSTSLSVSSITTTGGVTLSGASITSLNATITFNQAPTTVPSISNTSIVCTTAGSLFLTITTTSSTVYQVTNDEIVSADDPCTLTIGTGTGLTTASTTAFTFAQTHIFDTSPNGTLTGSQSGSLFGASLVMGDVDGNTVADVIVGAPGYDDGANSNMGRITSYIIQSGLSGRTLATPGTTSIMTITGAVTDNPLLGTSVCYRSGGTPVVVGGSPLYFVGGTARGAIETYSPPNGVLQNTITGELTIQIRFGQSCATGDFNNNGVQDILVGGSDGNTDNGRAYVYQGTTLLQTFFGDSTANASFGQTVANLGDVNGDGIADLAVSAPDQSIAANTSGKVFVHFGNLSGLQGTASQTFTPPGTTGLYGRAITGGDVNGDGFSDMIVGAPGDGQIFVYYGAASGLATSAGTQIGSSSSSGNEGRGRALATADFDGDGFDDLAVLKIPLSSRAAASGSVTVSIYRGRFIGLSTTPFQTITVGTSVEGGSSDGSLATGNYNGDGSVDIAVGVAETTASAAGEVFLFTNEL